MAKAAKVSPKASADVRKYLSVVQNEKAQFSAET